MGAGPGPAPFNLYIYFTVASAVSLPPLLSTQSTLTVSPDFRPDRLVPISGLVDTAWLSEAYTAGVPLTEKFIVVM